ncbi:hypothetical protein [Nitratireductor sp. GCM10026969]|uniref:hypothetical protein n=1 Tax=Nitratireductor sp. GCM10026969 TaxID=3252645 RepID=UPI003618F92F
MFRLQFSRVLVGVSMVIVSYPAAGGALSAWPVTVGNEGRSAIDCKAEIAHWFSLDLAMIPPGTEGGFTLWVDDSTGTHFARNAHGEPLPVERVWCGIAGKAYVTRWTIPLDRTPHARATPLHLGCAPAGDRLECR